MTLVGIPLWLAGILTMAALSLLAGAHFLHRRYGRATVPTLLFWTDVAKKHRQNSLLGRFRHLWTFLFLTIAVLLFLAALVRPVFQGSGEGWTHTVILFDRGASMGLTNPGASQTRFQQAQDRCMKFLNGCPRPNGVMLVDVGPTARVITNMTDPITDACLYIKRQSVSPCKTHTSMQHALALAEAMVTSHEPTNVMVFTDHACRLNGRSEQLNLRTTIVQVGEPVGNLALLHPVVVRDSGPWSRLEVSLACWGQERCAGQLELTRDQSIRQQQDFVVEANTIKSLSFQVKTDTLDSLTVRANCPDGLLQDNRCKLAGSPVIRVFLADRMPLALEAAFDARGQFQRVASPNDADLIVHHAGDPFPGSIPRVVIVTQGSPLDAFTPIDIAEPLWPEQASRNHLEADLIAGPGVALDGLSEKAVVLLSNGEGRPLAALESLEKNPVLYLSQALFHERATFWKQPQFPVILDALINTTLSHPVWPNAIGADWGGDLTYSDLYHVPTSEFVPSKQAYGGTVYQVLLALVLLMCVTEMICFYSGQIV